MKNVVSFETAKALRAAGFPQPQPQPGQFWYYRTGEPNVVTHTHVSDVAIADMHTFGRFCRLTRDDFGVIVEPPFPELTFAPIATDILEQLPHDEFAMYFKLKWICMKVDPFDIEIRDTDDENPAEAVAKMWLKINKK